MQTKFLINSAYTILEVNNNVILLVSKYYIIVNPVSGSKNGLSILDLVLKELNRGGIEVDVAISNYRNHPFELIRSVDFDIYNAICVIGGDGTYHEVINGMLTRRDKKKLPIGFIPGGTGNSLMHEIGSLDPFLATKKIIAGKKRKLDLLKIQFDNEQVYCFNILGWGIPSSANILAEKMRFIGGHRYNIASIVELLKNISFKATVQLNQDSIEDDFSFILACNTKYTGNGMKMSPQSKFDDGVFEVILVRKLSSLKLISLFIKLFQGTHLSDPAIQLVKVKSLAIVSDTKMPLNIDGQVKGFSPFNAKILDEVLEIFI